MVKYERSVLGMKMNRAKTMMTTTLAMSMKTRTVHIMRLIFHGEFYLLPLKTEDEKENTCNGRNESREKISCIKLVTHSLSVCVCVQVCE